MPTSSRAGLVFATTFLLLLALTRSAAQFPPGHGPSSPIVPAVDDFVDSLPGGPTMQALEQPLPLKPLARLGPVRFRYGGSPGGLAYCPGGKQLISVHLDGQPRLWEVASGKEVRCFPTQEKVRCLALSADGKLLATSIGSNYISLWEVATAKPVREFLVHPSLWLCCLAFSPDGKRLACGGAGEGLQVCDVAAGKPLGDPSGPKRVCSVRYSPNGQVLAAGYGDGRIRLYDAGTGRLLHGPLGEERPSPVSALAFAANGQSVAGGTDHVVRVWDVAQGAPLGELDVLQGAGVAELDAGPYQVLSVACSCQGLVASGHANGLVCLWQPGTARLLHRLRDTHYHEVLGLAFSPDGRTLASTAWHESRVAFWEVASGRARYSPQRQHWLRQPIAFAPDGKTLCGRGAGGVVRAWEVDTGREVRKWRESRPGGRVFVTHSPDGKLVAWADGDDSVVVREALTGKSLRQLRTPGSRPLGIVFSPDSKTLAADLSHKAGGSSVVLWDVATGKKQARTRGSCGPIAFSPDGQTVLTASSWDSEARLWRPATGQELRASEPSIPWRDYGIVPWLAFASDSRTWLVSNEEKAVIDLRETATGQLRLRLEGARDHGDRAVFSPDGKFLATLGKGDRPIHVWSLATGKLVFTACLQRGGIEALAFSPNGQLLAAATRDETVFLWDLTAQVRVGRRAAPLSPSVLERLWADLGGTNAIRAYRAVWLLASASDQAVDFLRRRLRPVQAVPAQRFTRLIAELDSGRFTARQEAARKLAELGALAEPYLRKLLAGRPSPESRRRVEQILHEVRRWVPPLSELQCLRAVEVLEQTGTVAAKQLLGELAQGASDARLTEEAKASLRRLTGLRRQ